MSAKHWEAFTKVLRSLGSARRDATGVTTVRADWGFLIVPPRGFPELRLNCYKLTEAGTENYIKSRILDALHQTLAESDRHDR